MSKILSPAILGIGILAILAGLTGAYVVRMALRQSPPRREAPKLQVVPLATIDLPAGRRISLGDVGLYSMTPAEIKAKNLDMTVTMIEPEQIIGRTLKVPVSQGQPFLSTALYLEGTRPSVLDRLKPGLRTYTLLLSKERIGALTASSRVDVLFRSTATNTNRINQTQQPVPELTVTLMRGVEILDIYEPPPPPAARGGNTRQAARPLDLDARNRNTTPLPQVTLAVTPEQALKLQAVQGRGEISLVGWPHDGAGEGTGRVPRQLSLRDVLALRDPDKPDDFYSEIYRKKARSVNWFRDGKLVQQGAGNGADQNQPGYQIAPDSEETPPPPPAPAPENKAASAKPQQRVRVDAGNPPQQAGPETDPATAIDPQFFFFQE